MAHPAAYYLRYLALFLEDGSDESVCRHVQALGFAPPTPADTERARQEVASPPENFSPWNRQDRASARWLREKRIYSLVHPDAATLEMREAVLANPRLRADVERLVLGNVDPDEAAHRLRKTRRHVSAAAIREYRHYFWNPEVIGLADWADYFDQARLTRAEASAHRAALAAGPELAMYRTGLEKELDSQRILREVQRELYFTFQETRAMPLSARKVEMLSNLARGLARVDERMQSSDTALQDVLKRFERFRVRAGQEQGVSLFDLAPTGSITNKSRQEVLTSRRDDN